MAMITPSEGRAFQRDPNEGNIPTGMYQCKLTAVREAPPSAKFPGSNPRLVFEFTVDDPQYPQFAGRTAIAFIGKTLLKNKEGRESNLVKWARMMGVPRPELGFDPDTLVGKRFTVMAEYTEARSPGETGRAWARQAMASSGAPAVAPAPQQSFSGLWDVSDGQNVLPKQTREQVEALIAGGADVNALKVKPAGSPKEQAKTAREYGFGVPEYADPQTAGGEIPW